MTHFSKSEEYFVVLEPGGPVMDRLFEGETLEVDHGKNGEPDIVSVRSPGGTFNQAHEGSLCGRGMTVQEARILVSRLRTVAEVLDA